MPDVGFGGCQCDVEDMPAVRHVPIEDILRQHRKRFIIRTAQYGDVVMRYLSRSYRVPIDGIRHEMYPELVEWEDEFRTLVPLASLPDADSDLRTYVQELAAKIMPTLDLYAIGCIEHPVLNSVDDLNVFLDLLTPEEQEAVRQMLSVLTAHAGPVDTVYMDIAERFDVKIIDKELMDNMTMQQQEVLQAVLKAERQRERQLYKQMGVKL